MKIKDWIEELSKLPPEADLDISVQLLDFSSESEQVNVFVPLAEGDFIEFQRDSAGHYSFVTEGELSLHLSQVARAIDKELSARKSK